MDPVPLHLFVTDPLEAALVFGLLAFFGTPVYLGIRRHVLRRGMDS